MEIIGTVVLNNGVEHGTSKSGKEWAKASLVVETEGQYPKKVLLTNFKDAEKFATLQVSTKGTFHVEIESREWVNAQGKAMWFTEVNCWKWEVTANAAPQSQYEPPVQPMAQPQLDNNPFPF